MSTAEGDGTSAASPLSRSTVVGLAILLAAPVGACLFLLYMWLDLSADYSVATKDLLARTKTAAKARSEAQQLQYQVRELESIIKSQNKALEEGGKLRSQQNASIRRLVQQSQDLRQDLRAEIKTLKDEVRRLKIELAMYKTEPAEAVAKLARFRAETAGIMEYLRTLADAHKAEMQRAHKKIKDLEQELSGARAADR